jgi:hypothetical protein
MEEREIPVLVVVRAGQRDQLDDLRTTLSRVNDEVGPIVRDEASEDFRFDPALALDLSWKLMTVVTSAAAKELVVWAIEEIKKRREAAGASKKSQPESSQAPLVIKVKDTVVTIRGDVDPDAVRTTLEAAFGLKA